MIVYVDSSVLVRAYLVDEQDHLAAHELVVTSPLTLITGSWTRIEVTGSLARAARAHRGDVESLLALLDQDLDPAQNRIAIIDADQAEVEGIALDLVRRTGIRSLDAWHLACAQLAFDELAEPGEEQGFASRDATQAAVALDLGFTLV